MLADCSERARPMIHEHNQQLVTVTQMSLHCMSLVKLGELGSGNKL